MKRSEAGFTLIEVVVAFTVVTIVLASLYQAIAGAWHGFARTKVRDETLALARAQLATIGVEEPLQPGERSGTYATNVAWRLTVEPSQAASGRGRAFRVLLEARDAGGKPLMRLETFKLDRVTN